MNEMKRVAFVKLYPDITGEQFSIDASLMKWVKDSSNCENPSFITFQNNTVEYNPLWRQHKFYYLNTDSEDEFSNKMKEINRAFDLLIVIVNENIVDPYIYHGLFSFLKQANVPMITIMKYLPFDEELTEMVQYVINKSSHIFSVSNFITNSLFKNFYLDEAKLETIKDWSEAIAKDGQIEMKKLFGLEENKVLLSVGPMKPTTYFDGLILKLEKLLHHNNYKLVIIGEPYNNEISDIYHSYLEALIKEHKLEHKIWLIDMRLEEKDLLSFINMSDIYISPIMDMNNIYDPLLTTALSNNCLTIASPYPYAKEVLDNNRGLIYDFNHTDDKNLLLAIESSMKEESIKRGFNYNKRNIEDSRQLKMKFNKILCNLNVEPYKNQYQEA